MKLNTQPFYRRAKCAFTLAEVLIGAAIVLILFLSLYAGISAGFMTTKMARENLRATQIMLERMEGVRLYNWNQLVYSNSVYNNYIPTNFTDYYYPLTNAGQSAGIAYKGSLTVSGVTFPGTAPNYAGDMRMVVVKVYWTNSVGTNDYVRTRSMSTMVGRMGMQNYIYYN